MPIRKQNLATERIGVNYVRGVVEANNSIFKEQDLRHDYGHDAFVLLVEEEQVSSKEIAMQIKSGVSYCTQTSCKIPATGGQLTFWAGHDLVTLGVVYDASEKAGYWIDLKEEAKHLLRGRREKRHATIEFPKLVWNRFDRHMFRDFLVPVLLGKAPLLDLNLAIEWAHCDDIETHDIGVRILIARHWRELDAWKTLFDLFYKRQTVQLTPNLLIGFAKMMGHPDDGYSMRDAPQEVKEFVRSGILGFGARELAKVLAQVEDCTFERPSFGYSLLPIVGARHDCVDVFAAIRDDPGFEDISRRLAKYLIDFDKYESLHWWHSK